MQKRGFTLTEFVICITVMFVVAAFSTPILFKKAKTPLEGSKKVGEWTCAPVEEVAPAGGGSPTSVATGGCCDYIITESDNASAKHSEFFSVQLIGGGAHVINQSDASTKYKGANAGESKIIYLPYMTGSYKVCIGEGGTASAPNGGSTALYKVSGGVLELIDYAKGGIATNEKVDDDISEDEKKLQELGKLPTLSNSVANGTTTSIRGRGADATASGATAALPGEAVIRW